MGINIIAPFTLIFILSVTSFALADYARGMEYFRKSLAAYQGRELNEALSLAKSAIAEDPRNAQSFALAGDIYYNLQELGQAKESWKKALELNPRLDTLKEKINQVEAEAKVEDKLEQDKEEIFEIRLAAGSALTAQDSQLKTYLKSAYAEIGRDFNYYPKHKIIVLLYPPKDFAQIRALPEWIAGLYDGKIRIPVRAGSQAEMERIIRHEYTHSLVFDLSKGKCPVFLNEGLAEYESGPRPKAHGPQPYPLITLFLPENLNNKELNLDARKFYDDSRSLTEYIISIWGWEGIRRLLEDIAGGAPWPQGIQKTLRITPQELEKRWLHS